MRYPAFDLVGMLVLPGLARSGFSRFFLQPCLCPLGPLFQAVQSRKRNMFRRGYGHVGLHDLAGWLHRCPTLASSAPVSSQSGCFRIRYPSCHSCGCPRHHKDVLEVLCNNFHELFGLFVLAYNHLAEAHYLFHVFKEKLGASHSLHF